MLNFLPALHTPNIFQQSASHCLPSSIQNSLRYFHPAFTRRATGHIVGRFRAEIFCLRVINVVTNTLLFLFPSSSSSSSPSSSPPSSPPPSSPSPPPPPYSPSPPPPSSPSSFQFSFLFPSSSSPPPPPTTTSSSPPPPPYSPSPSSSPSSFPFSFSSSSWSVIRPRQRHVIMFNLISLNVAPHFSVPKAIQ